MEKTVNKLPDEVGEKYRVLKGRPFVFVHPVAGRVDLTKANVKLVERLIDLGVKHIVPVKYKKEKQ